MLQTPQVAAVEPREDFTLLLTFTNGEQRVFDMRPELETQVFGPLKDPSLFRQVKIVYGCLEWPGERDLAYDMLYVQSVPAPIEAG